MPLLSIKRVAVLCCLAALSALAPGRAFAQALAEELRETVEKISATVTLPSGRQHSGQIVVTHFRPKGDGPFPIVIFNHGRSPQEERAKIPRYRHLSLANFFVRRGFAVFEPTRFGYGDSGTNPDPESNAASCSAQQYAAILNAMIAQNEATLKFAKSLPWTDSSRVIVIGQSYGGFATIGASGARQLNVTGAINFVGGAGGKSKSEPCGGSQVASVIAEVGKNASRPSLWLYAQNDSFWGANWPRQWHAAYVKAGGRADFVMFPPVAEDGHKLISKGFRLWRPVVDRYLARLGFPPPKSPNAPPPSDFARLDEADKLPYVRDDVKTDGYQKFLEADVPRAFVISTAGAWSWRTGEGATEKALTWCKERSKGSCHLYAVDDAVVFKPPASAEAAPAR